MEAPTEVTVSVVTPEIAQKWLAESRYEHQREVRPLQVKFLAEEIERDCFKQDTVIEFSVVNGVEYLTDGQHRLTAVIVSQKPQRFVIVKRFLKDELAVAKDYTRTDQVIIRTVSDSYKTLSLDIELGRTPTQINSLGVAATIIFDKFNPSRQMRRIHPDDRLATMRQYNGAYGLYLDSLAGSRRELRHSLERAATLSVALVTFHFSVDAYGYDKVYDFWHGLSQDDGLKRDDPRKAALRHISETYVAGGGNQRSKQVTNSFSQRYLATCFNAYMQGKALQYARPDPTAPILILGSPFVGK